MKSIAAIDWTNFFQSETAFKTLLPLLGYIVFGLANIYFFSLALKDIPSSTAFAVWMGLALVFSKAVDILAFQQTWNVKQLFFTALILVGIIGLKRFA